LPTVSAALDSTTERTMSDGKPVDRPDAQTVQTRQGAGPRAMVTVLLLSLVLAVLAGAALGLYYLFARPPAQTTGFAPLVALFAHRSQRSASGR
jgi:hypothetical protein